MDLIRTLDDTVDAVREANVPPDPVAQAELLALSLQVSEETMGLARRLVVRLRGAADADCDSPPDLHGLCLDCGRKIAPAVASHKPGCDPLAIVALRLYRLVVRIQRLSRLLWAAAQHSEGAD